MMSICHIGEMLNSHLKVTHWLKTQFVLAEVVLERKEARFFFRKSRCAKTVFEILSDEKL